MDLYDIAIARKLAGSGGGGGGGSSDFSTAELGLSASDASYRVALSALIPQLDSIGTAFVDVTMRQSMTVTIPLYKGSAYIDPLMFTGVDTSEPPICSGDVVFSNGYFIVTGNGAITCKGVIS